LIIFIAPKIYCRTSSILLLSSAAMFSCQGKPALTSVIATELMFHRLPALPAPITHLGWHYAGMKRKRFLYGFNSYSLGNQFLWVLQNLLL
jgi:hypothetical protein